MIPEPDKIAFAGDWHGDTAYGEKAIYAAAENDCQVILHCGDFGFTFTKSFVKGLGKALEDTDMHLIFVRGNHDDPYLLDGWPRDDQGFGTPRYGSVGGQRLHYCPQAHRWQWWGKTFMGLGGAHSVDRPWRTPMLDWWPDEWVSTGDIYRAIEGGKVDVMVTHDLPANAKLPNDRKALSHTSPFPYAELVQAEQHRILLQSVVDEVQPELLVHGHFHESFAQKVGGMRVVGLDMNGSPLHKNLWIVGKDLAEIEFEYPVMVNMPKFMVHVGLAPDVATAQSLLLRGAVRINNRQVSRDHALHDMVARHLFGKTITSGKGRTFTCGETVEDLGSARPGPVLPDGRAEDDQGAEAS